MAQNSSGKSSAAGPLDRLMSEATELQSKATDLLGAFGEEAVTSLKTRVEDATGRLTEHAKGSATPAVKAAATGAKSLAQGKSPARSMLVAGKKAAKEKISEMSGKNGGENKGKVTNIVESIDVGVPIRLAYDQWTQFTEFPRVMKKVESVDQPEDQKVTFKAKVLWSHRSWESTILEQKPEDKIVWCSKGSKGYVDGAVTFHELAPNLTRILLVLEYHPQGFFEKTGNLWRAQGRRVRLELKNFRRHVMTEAVLHPEEVEGWRGVISDGEVQQSNGKGNAGKSQSGRSSTRSDSSRRAKSQSGRSSSKSSSASSSRQSARNSR